MTCSYIILYDLYISIDGPLDLSDDETYTYRKHYVVIDSHGLLDIA